MTGKKTRPVIGKLSTNGLRSGVTEVGTSPRTPLEFKILSPRGMVNCDVGGVGLGIVAALENDVQAKNTTFGCRNPIRSLPIPVNQAPKVGVDQESLEEEYTIVTRHMPNNSYTKVYDGGFLYEGCVTKNGIKLGGGKGSKSREGCAFHISPARLGGDIKGFPAPDFLSSCHLCKKKLHGKDIYMYRGEKAFCSTECRLREIGMDERREKHCSSEAVSSSPCSHAQMMSTGIFAI